MQKLYPYELNKRVLLFDTFIFRNPYVKEFFKWCTSLKNGVVFLFQHWVKMSMWQLQCRKSREVNCEIEK